MQVNLTRIDLAVVGAPGGGYAELCADYERRLGKYVRLEVHVVKGEPLQRGDDAVRAAEAARLAPILDRAESEAGPGSLIVACDGGGRSLDTEALATRVLAPQRLVVVVGGAAGLDRSILERAGLTLAFGAVTLPHQLARVVLTEQLYRAFKIARNEPYHH